MEPLSLSFFTTVLTLWMEDVLMMTLKAVFLNMAGTIHSNCKYRIQHDWFSKNKLKVHLTHDPYAHIRAPKWSNLTTFAKLDTTQHRRIPVNVNASRLLAASVRTLSAPPHPSLCRCISDVIY